MKNYTCPKRYGCYSYNHTDCDGCNDANTWYGPKPELSEWLRRQFEKNVNDAILKGENTMPTKEERAYVRHDFASLAQAFQNISNAFNKKLPGIKTVHFSGPVTAVIWEDKTKTIVRCKDGEEPDYEKGLAMAIAKKALGTNKSGSNYYDIFKQWLPKPEAADFESFPPEPKEGNQDG